jgi:hypothetical protein
MQQTAIFLRTSTRLNANNAHPDTNFLMKGNELLRSLQRTQQQEQQQ